jgi:DNA-binding NarL/FixJ family response regulator
MERIDREPMRVFIADDYNGFRKLISKLVQSIPGLEVCGEAANGRDALHKIERLRPDLIILDISMPQMDGLKTAKEIRKLLPTPILFVTVHAELAICLAAQECGAQGLISKSSLPQSLVTAVDAIRTGQPFFVSPDAQS